MDTTRQAATTTSSRVATLIRNTLVGLATLTTIGTPAPADANNAAGSTESAAHQTANPTPPIPVTHSSTDRGPTPDATAEYTGGIAARLHTTDSTPSPGNVFILMATPGSDSPAQLYDHTPYTHDNGTAADAHGSNIDAAAAAEAITSADIDLLDFTTAPGGGPSAGITYTIAYLNVISNGAFTGNIRIAATGRLATNGYVRPINAINEKTAAANLADADVLFTPSTPDAQHLNTYSARHVGELFRARNTGTTLADERNLDSYHTWGATRPDGLDIVGIRHIADVAAYLCGNGSTYACHVTDHYNNTIIGAPASSDGPDETSATLVPARLH
jgi:hypothetical protein